VAVAKLDLPAYVADAVKHARTVRTLKRHLLISRRRRRCKRRV